jgi:enoyl-CoA hydratase
MTESPTVKVERRGPCAWVTLDRPPLNLMTPEMITALSEAFGALERESDVRAAVITGAGRVMTGGMQIEALRDLSEAGAEALITTLHEALRAVHEAPFPTICMMNGDCLGAGFELAMACDLRTAGADVRMGLPEIRVGIPSVIHAALLPGLVGPGRAAEHLLTGESIAARQALDWGLVNRVAPLDHVEAVTLELLGRILECSPAAVRLQKELIINWRNADQRSAIEQGINAFARAYATREPHEAMDAFLEKREPKFVTDDGR